MPTEKPNLESSLLDFLSGGRLQIQSFQNLDFLHGQFPRSAFITGDNLELVQQALWGLILRGLVWLRVGQTAGLWTFELTERGRRVAFSDDPNPDEPHGYMARIIKSAPATSETVKMYLLEAVESYANRTYLSSMVMLGVAAEACTFDTALLYVNWAGPRADKLKTILDGKDFYVYKLEEFNKRLEADKDKFPRNIKDTLHVDLIALLQLIRLTRNEAGYPSGIKFERDDCNCRLQMYSFLHKKLYQLQDLVVFIRLYSR